jgi:hypothetical protein
MTREEFLSALRALRMNQGQFARHAGVHPTTVYHWGTTGGPFPKWAEMLLAAWEAHRELERELESAMVRLADLSIPETTLQSSRRRRRTDQST